MAPSQRTEIAACIEDLEAAAPWAPGDAAWLDEPLPEALFGCWRLLWASSPDVLSLSVIPLVDCGQIRQDVPPQPQRRPGQPLELLNTVELSPKGAALLGAVPLLGAFFGAKVTIKALADVRTGGGLSIRFTGGYIDALNNAPLPRLALPDMPSQSSSSTNLLTTYLDDEIRIARSPLGDAFVLLKVAA